MSYLHFFTPHNLAMLSDWLAQTGELYVDVYWPHSGGGSTGFLIRTMQDLKSLVLHQITRPEMAFTIFREIQLPLRGIANEAFLEQILQQFPGSPPCLASLRYYPDSCYVEEFETYDEFRAGFAEDPGWPVAIGVAPPIFTPIQEQSINDVFDVDVLGRNNYQVMRNQEAYAPYDADPEHYQWLVEMWQSEEVRLFNHLPVFKIDDLAKIADWLLESGELYVYVHPYPVVDGHSAHYLIRSVQDLRRLVLQEGRRLQVGFSIFRRNLFPLRGMANGDFLKEALHQLPEGGSYHVSTCAYYPEPCRSINTLTSHTALLRVFEAEWGRPLMISSTFSFDPYRQTKEEKIEVSPKPRSSFHGYAPYETNPTRYQWIVNMWQE